MEYSIKELKAEWVSKNLVYTVLKNSLPLSEKFVKNKRVFNEYDLNIFIFYKKYWKDKTVLMYWNREEPANNELTKNSFTNKLKLFSNNNISSGLKNKEDLSNQMQTVLKQFEKKEKELLLNVEQQKKIIEIKDEQNKKYALLKIEEVKEKKEWIQKYELELEKKDLWMQKFYKIKTYLIVSIVVSFFLAMFLTLIFMFSSSFF